MQRACGLDAQLKGLGAIRRHGILQALLLGICAQPGAGACKGPRTPTGSGSPDLSRFRIWSEPNTRLRFKYASDAH